MAKAAMLLVIVLFMPVTVLGFVCAATRVSFLVGWGCLRSLLDAATD